MADCLENSLLQRTVANSLHTTVRYNNEYVFSREKWRYLKTRKGMFDIIVGDVIAGNQTQPVTKIQVSRPTIATDWNH